MVGDGGGGQTVGERADMASRRQTWRLMVGEGWGGGVMSRNFN